jgi:ATP-dependent helicase YprA (DUF1998 family)
MSCNGRFYQQRFDAASDLLIRALESVKSCDCGDGCEDCELAGSKFFEKWPLTDDNRYSQRSL